MQRKTLVLAVIALLLFVLLPAAGLAYTYGGAAYNNNDYYKLRSFLEQTSADGTKNGERLNSAIIRMTLSHGRESHGGSWVPSCA